MTDQVGAVHTIRNTDKDYPCTNCGSDRTSIVREGSDPRLKCSSCNFMFNASDSKKAKDAGAIPAEAPKIEPPQSDPMKVDRGIKIDEKRPIARLEPKKDSIPRTPSYVLISKNRKHTEVEFATLKTLKGTILKWQSEDKGYDIYELQKKSVQVKVAID